MSGERFVWRAWVALPRVPGPGVIRAGEEFTAAADDPRVQSGRALRLGPVDAPAAAPPAEVAAALEAAVAGPPARKRAPRKKPPADG